MAYKDPEKERAHSAAYRAENREKLRAKQNAYHAANPEKRRAYLDANREKIRAYKAAYHAANPEKGRAARARRRAENPDKIRAQEGAWRGRYPVEAKVEQYLVQGVKARGGMCPKFNDPGRRGAPDRLVCLPGHATYFVELKRPKMGKLDAHQIRYHDSLRAAGQRVWVIWSYEEVDGFFADI
jgi:hypothetical protein